jgi:drug/metabolite transporter (DMT)-like permease
LSPGSIAGFAFVVSCTIVANVLLRLGALASPARRVVLGILSWQSVAGLMLFGLGGLAYSILLRRVPLNVAQVFGATQFVGVILAARAILHEPISNLRWIGILFTCIGVVIVGLTTNK